MFIRSALGHNANYYSLIRITQDQFNSTLSAPSKFPTSALSGSGKFISPQRPRLSQNTFGVARIIFLIEENTLHTFKTEFPNDCRACVNFASKTCRYRALRRRSCV